MCNAGSLIWQCQVRQYVRCIRSMCKCVYLLLRVSHYAAMIALCPPGPASVRGCRGEKSLHSGLHCSQVHILMLSFQRAVPVFLSLV